MKDAADHTSIVHPLRPWAVLRQMRLDRSPDLITDPIDPFHERSSGQYPE